MIKVEIIKSSDKLEKQVSYNVCYSKSLTVKLNLLINLCK
jgi:hypothetical protein